MGLEQISAALRLFALAWSIIGLALACAALVSAHLDTVAVGRNGTVRALARAARTKEALSVAVQVSLFAIAVSLIASPPALPASVAQLDPYVSGLYRIGGFGLAALLLAIRSAIALIAEGRIRQRLI